MTGPFHQNSLYYEAKGDYVFHAVILWTQTGHKIRKVRRYKTLLQTMRLYEKKT